VRDVTEVERRIAEHLEMGDLRAAADESVRGYGEEIAGYLLTLVREEAAADEVFSRVCEKLCRGLPRFRRQSSLRTWLYRLAWNAALDFQKEQERTPIRALRTTEVSRIAAEVAASRAPFERSSFVDAFAKLRDSLDPQEQTLLTLRLHAGMSWNEIAEVVDRKPAALRKRYERLKARLRKQAEGAGLLRR
jgi:RNA polymerase sigma-70 factor (ECF subfamily)